MTTPHDKALLPCPFCGSTDQMVLPPTCDRNTPYNENDRAFPIVRCLGCITDVSGKDFDASCQSSIDHWNRRTPIEAGNGEDGWNRDMDAAPKDKSPVIIAVLHKDNDAYIIGEAYFDPEHYGNGDWWWAGNSYEDYHGGPISEINYYGPSAWRHLPPPPSPSNEGEKP